MERSSISLFDFSQKTIDSLNYPSSYETTIPSSISLFNLDSNESSVTDYDFAPIQGFSHPHEIRVPQSSSTGFPQQDEGYVTPDFEADEITDELHTIKANEPMEPWPSRCWDYLLGFVSKDKPLLSSYRDADESLEKMLWLDRSDKTKWYPNDPEVVSLEEFVRDLKYLIVGVPSLSFQLDLDSNTFSIAPNIKLTGISVQCMAALMEEFITCGNAANQLSRLASNTTKVHHGLVYHTLCQTLSVYLQCVRSQIFQLDLSLSALAAVIYTTAPIRTQLIAMSKACYGFESDTPPTGGAIIDRLFIELQSMATPDGEALVYSVLRPCLDIYSKFLFKWIFKGEIEDPYQEFFIDKKFPHIISNSRNFWTRGFVCVDKLLPSYLSDIKDEILACGKTMCLLKICDPNNPLFQLIDESSITMDICDSYESLKEIRQKINLYYLQCEKTLGTRIGFMVTENRKSEKWLYEAARSAREKNLADYQEKRRLKLQKIADKKYKELLELKQGIDDLKLKKEQEEKLRLEAERVWLEQIQKEQELDMILEQTKQAKIGEFYKSLLEKSQKRVALTVWKIKRSKLAAQRANYFREEAHLYAEPSETSDNIPSSKIEKIPSAVVELPATDKGLALDFESEKLETDDLISSFFKHSDDGSNQESECLADISSNFEQNNLSLAENSTSLTKTNLNLAKISPNLSTITESLVDMSPNFDQNNMNFRAWLDDKDQALKNRVKVLSSGLGDIFIDTDVILKVSSGDKISSKNLKAASSLCELDRKNCELNSEKSSSSEKKVTLDPEEKFGDFEFFKSSNVESIIDKSSNAEIVIDKSNVDEKLCDTEFFKSSDVESIVDKSSNAENVINKSNFDEPPSSKSGADKSPIAKTDISKSNNTKSCIDKSSEMNTSDCCKTDIISEKSLSNSNQLSELDDERFSNLSSLPLKTDIIDQILDSARTSRPKSSHDLTMISSFCIESAQLPLRVHTLVANYSLMKHFVDLKFIDQLRLLKNHFLLHDAGFRTQFVHSLAGCLREFRGLNAGQVEWNSVLVEALLQSKPQEVDPAQFLKLGVENAPAILDITSLEVFDCFLLQYQVEWPLNLIITPDAISRYNTIFKFLLKVMYVDWILMSNFKLLSDKRIKRGHHYKRICLFRHCMTQFIHPLSGFISESIVESEFVHLLKELEKDCRIDSVYYKHVDFVKSLIFNCFLTAKSESISKAFKTLFKNVLQFNEALVQGTWKLDRGTDQLVHSNFDKLQLYFRNFISLAADTCDFLRKLADSGYQVKLNNLTAQLSLNFQPHKETHGEL